MESLPGGTAVISCNVSSVMTGTASTYFDSANTTFDTLKMIGNISDYKLSVSVSTSETALLQSAVSASTTVRIDECADTEFYDANSDTCVCIANSQRNDLGVCEVRPKAFAQMGSCVSVSAVVYVNFVGALGRSSLDTDI